MSISGLLQLTDVTFIWWWALWLLPLPLLVWLFSKNGANDDLNDLDKDMPNDGALSVPFFEQLASKVGSQRQPKHDPKPFGFRNWWKWLLLCVSWVLLLVAVSRPTLVGEKIPLPVAGRDIMLAMDLSGSMAAEDLGVPANRLDVVKATANEFIGRRAGDRIGLIFFSDRAYLQSPLTFDRTVVQALLGEANVGLTGQRTAIGDAIAIGLKRLRETEAQSSVKLTTGESDPKTDQASKDELASGQDSRVLILLTDGANNAGVTSPEKASAIAKKLSIKIYTIGVGGEPQGINTPFGRPMMATSDLDEPALKQIAEMTGGQYFRATDMADLEQIYQMIDQLEPVNRDPKFFYPQIDLYYYPALGSLAAFMLLMFLSALGNVARNRKSLS